MARQKPKPRDLFILAALLLILGIVDDDKQTAEKLQRVEPPAPVFFVDDQGALQMADIKEDYRTLELFGLEVQK